jgi:hypothetical protein
MTAGSPLDDVLEQRLDVTALNAGHRADALCITGQKGANELDGCDSAPSCRKTSARRRNPFARAAIGDP